MKEYFKLAAQSVFWFVPPYKRGSELIASKMLISSLKEIIENLRYEIDKSHMLFYLQKIQAEQYEYKSDILKFIAFIVWPVIFMITYLIIL